MVSKSATSIRVLFTLLCTFTIIAVLSTSESLNVNNFPLINKSLPQSFISKYFSSFDPDNEAVDIQATCPIYPPIRPKSYNRNKLKLANIISSKSFRTKSAQKLSKAVKINTSVYDDDPSVQQNPRLWDSRFKPFHEYLRQTFPLIHQNLRVEKVNQWGLVYTWRGSNPRKKPVLLMAHQDVVPVPKETLSQWKYPPFEGVYDGEYLWGRGSADCKNLLVGILESIEELIKDGFQPTRTILLGFGFDEEISGSRGARNIANYLLESYGRNSLYAILDEGGQSLVEQEGVVLALPGTGEKGYIDVKVELFTPGGHSSVPPDHTSIGILSELVSLIESTPFEGIFTPRNPTFMEYQCIAAHSKRINKNLKSDILNSSKNQRSNSKVIDYLSSSKATRYLIKTSQAIDIIKGGTKSNALPEHSEIIVNHRVAIESNTNSVLSKDISNVRQIASKYNLGLIFKDKTLIPATSNGHFIISALEPLEPAPTTPINDKKWEILAGTIRHAYEEIAYPNKFSEPIIVAPGIATGNTDTRYYWDLTKHIYRYRPGIVTTVESGAHGINEHIPFDSHLSIIVFYYEYLQAIDEVDD